MLVLEGFSRENESFILNGHGIVTFKPTGKTVGIIYNNWNTYSIDLSEGESQNLGVVHLINLKELIESIYQ